MGAGIVRCAAEGSEIRPGESGVVIGGFRFPWDPFQRPLPDSDIFDVFLSVNVVAGTTQELVTIELARNEWARISNLGQEILDDPAGTAVIGFANTQWRVLVGQVRDRFFGDVRDQVGLGHQPTEVFIRVDRPGAQIAFRVQNTHATSAFLCFGRLRGWTIPLNNRI